jgi:hypothetical protein
MSVAEHPELTKVDSAVAGLTISDEKAPDKADKKSHRRTSSQADGIYNIKELGIYLINPIHYRLAY